MTQLRGVPPRLLAAVGSLRFPRRSAALRIVGAWKVEAVGAPFATHIMVFNRDRTFWIDNPEAGDRNTSDSVGAGPWRVMPDGKVRGKFVEINADRSTGAHVSDLVVVFTLTVDHGRFDGPATAVYFDPQGNQIAGPFPATLHGLLIKPP